METWQKQIIEKCLPTLIALTKCSTGLKSELRAKQLITLEEDEQLAQTELTSGNSAAAKKLYDLLMRRTDSFDTLVHSLVDDLQSGAANILINEAAECSVKRPGTSHSLSAGETDEVKSEPRNERVKRRRSRRSTSSPESDTENEEKIYISKQLVAQRIRNMCKLLGFGCTNTCAGGEIRELFQHLEFGHHVSRHNFTKAVLCIPNFGNVPCNNTLQCAPILLDSFMLLVKLHGAKQTLSLECLQLSDEIFGGHHLTCVIQNESQQPDRKTSPLQWTVPVKNFLDAPFAITNPMLQIPVGDLQHVYTQKTALKIYASISKFDEIIVQHTPGSLVLIFKDEVILQPILSHIVGQPQTLAEGSGYTQGRGVENNIYEGIICNGCPVNPIRGIWFWCLQCENYKLCEECKDSGIHDKHMLIEIRCHLDHVEIERLKSDRLTQKYRPLVTTDIIVEKASQLSDGVTGQKRRASTRHYAPAPSVETLFSGLNNISPKEAPYAYILRRNGNVVVQEKRAINSSFFSSLF